MLSNTRAQLAVENPQLRPGSTPRQEIAVYIGISGQGRFRRAESTALRMIGPITGQFHTQHLAAGRGVSMGYASSRVWMGRMCGCLSRKRRPREEIGWGI